MRRFKMFIVLFGLLSVTACSFEQEPVTVEYKGIFNYADPSAERFIVVIAGDNLWNISQRYGTTLGDIARHNNIPAPYDITIGQKIYIPSIDSQRASSTGVSLASNSTASYSNNSKDSSNLVDKQVTKKPTSNNKNASRYFAVPTPLCKADFMWPLEGNVLQKFSKNKPNPHEGINISAALGADIKAAGSAEVIYVGNELEKYGNLVILKHANNYMTAYAHLSKIKVNLGQMVKKGQVIGLVGGTGAVDKPQLHFSIRHKSKVIDPCKCK